MVEKAPDFHFSKSPASPHCPSVNLPQLGGGGGSGGKGERHFRNSSEQSTNLKSSPCIEGLLCVTPCAGYWKYTGEWGMGPRL